MRRHFLFLPLVLLGCLVSGDSFTSEASAEASPPAAHQLRIATLAPRQSGLGKAFQQLRRELKEHTEGQVNLKMYDGGVAGDEMTVVRKMRVGQLDGALLTSTGLGALVPQVLVLQAPGLITSYPALDDVRAQLGPDLEARFDKAGYALISWGDSGQIRIFSKHKIQHPSDLQNVRPWVWRGSPTMRAFIEAAGANGVTMGLPEVYSGLQTGMVDTVIASSIGVLAFHLGTLPLGLPVPARRVLTGLAAALAFLALPCLLFRVIHIFGTVVETRFEARGLSSANRPVPLACKGLPAPLGAAGRLPQVISRQALAG